jgi:hypothetical protein
MGLRLCYAKRFGLVLALAGGLAPPLAPVAARTQAAFHPGRTSWGDPDFRATWTSDRVSQAGIPLERLAEQGERARLTDAEFARRVAAAAQSDERYEEDVDASGTVGLARWLRTTPFARRASLIVNPANGRLPPMTPQAQALFKAGRNSWIDGQPIDWVADLDTSDRCVARGVPAVILPWPQNNGVRVFQSPGWVVLQLEDTGPRVIPLRPESAWPAGVRTWGGQSRAHWEGDTLVIETGNIVTGDSASGDVHRHAASPITGRGHGVVPMGPRAHSVERLTMTAPGTMLYRVTYTDPGVFTAPWTAEVEWTRDDGYAMYEYACHEGNRVREWINASRAQRREDAAAAGGG